MRFLNLSNLLHRTSARRLHSGALPESQITTVLGAQWGDEGKGKLTDLLAKSHDITCRFNGGDNAGHTIVVNKKTFKFHLLPCGLVYPHTVNLIGNGVVLNLTSFFTELDNLTKNGVNTTNRVKISNRTHLLFDFYRLVDEQIELFRGDSKLGTTKKGIGPAYAAKALRLGLRTNDLVNLSFDDFKEKYLFTFGVFKQMFNLSFDPKSELDKLYSHRSLLKQENIIIDSVSFLKQSLKENKKILIEAANAAMLDIDFGSYPFVTSSSTTLGGVFTGLGTNLKDLGNSNVIGVVKAYTTRVGSGPFITEQLNSVGEYLQTKGFEIGTTTGRKRRCGYLDIPILTYSHSLNNYTCLNITKLDVLDELETIKICTKYKNKNTGYLLKSELGEFPSSLSELEEVEAVYEEVEGWKTDTSNVKSYEELPEKAKKYVEIIEKEANVEVKFIGVGAGRENMIVK